MEFKKMLAENNAGNIRKWIALSNKLKKVSFP